MSNEDKSFNKCLKLSGYVFLLTNIVLFWNAFYYVLLPNVFLEVNNDYQIILGLLHPIVKELSFRNYCHYHIIIFVRAVYGVDWPVYLVDQ